MVKNILSQKLYFIILFSLSTTLLFSQDIAKKKDKLRKKYDYVSNLSDKQTFLTGTYIKGPSDGGGGYPIGLKDLKIVNLDGKVIKESELSTYRIELQFGRNQEKYEYLLSLQDADNKIGLINTNGDILLPPTYDHINGFNSEGQAIAFKGNDIQVIDVNGKPLLKENYKYKVDYNSFFTIPTPGQINYYYVLNNTIICSKDGEHYGLLNIADNQSEIPFVYDKISTKLLIRGKDTIGYKVYKNNLATLVDFKTKKELAPFIFEDINDAISFKNTLYIKGENTLQNKRLINYFNVKQQKLTFKKGIEMYEASPVNDTYWILDSNGFSLFNIVKNENITTPEKIESITRLSDNLILYRQTQQSFWIYDIAKGKIIKQYTSEPDIRPFKLENDKYAKDYLMIYETKNGEYEKYVSMYDANLNSIFSDLHVYPYYEKDVVIAAETIEGKPIYTAYDVDGKMIGEQRTYKYKPR